MSSVLKKAGKHNLSLSLKNLARKGLNSMMNVSGL